MPKLPLQPLNNVYHKFIVILFVSSIIIEAQMNGDVIEIVLVVLLPINVSLAFLLLGFSYIYVEMPEEMKLRRKQQRMVICAQYGTMMEELRLMIS